MSMTDLLSAPTYRSTKGRVPIFRPLLNGEEFDILVKDASFVSAFDMHDIATLSVSSPTLTTTEGILDSTISFYWGTAPRTELFCGYVTNVQVDKAGKGNLTFAMQIIGATRPMQKGRPRFWRKKLVPSAVEALSYSNGLGYIGHDHTHLWEALAQTSESDWQMAVSLTKRLGWSIFNRYGVVMCYDPSIIMRDSGAYARLVSVETNEDFNVSNDRRLIEFTPAEAAEEVPQNMGAQIAYFTDKGDVQVAKEIGEFKAYRFFSAVIRNAEEAAIYTNSGKSRITEWKQRADARIWGDADILPGMLVDVVTANRAYYREKFDGRWMVVGAQHKMDVQQFQTQLQLGRPESRTQISQTPYTPFWTTVGKARPTLSIQDGAWISSWTDPRLRSIL